MWPHTCLSKIGCDDVVGPEGMEKFCEDIGVEPENVSRFFFFFLYFGFLVGFQFARFLLLFSLWLPVKISKLFQHPFGWGNMYCTSISDIF